MELFVKIIAWIALIATFSYWVNKFVYVREYSNPVLRFDKEFSVVDLFSTFIIVILVGRSLKWW